MRLTQANEGFKEPYGGLRTGIVVRADELVVACENELCRGREKGVILSLYVENVPFKFFHRPQWS